MSMAERDDGDVRSAQRRSERQPRSFLPHERMSVRMALAEALHHSAGQSTKKVVEWREGGGGGPPRPGVLLDPGQPLVEAVTVGYVAAGAPPGCAIVG